MTNMTFAQIQRTPEWILARLGKISASCMKDVMAGKTTAAYQNYRARLAAERMTQRPDGSGYTSEAIQWGIDHENEARSTYEFLTDLEVVETGFVLHPFLENSGASPDGLVGDDGLIEIKCPNTATHLKFLETEKIEPNYIKQMTFQLMCTEREWCDFVSFDPRLEGTSAFIRIKRFIPDQEMIDEIETRVRELNAEIEEMVNRWAT